MITQTPPDEGPLRCRQCRGDFATDDEGELCFRCRPADEEQKPEIDSAKEAQQ